MLGQVLCLLQPSATSAETREERAAPNEMRKFVSTMSHEAPLLLMRKGESIKVTSETFVTKLHLQTNTGNSSLTTGNFNCLSPLYSHLLVIEIEGSLLCSQLLLDAERDKERARRRK